MDSHGVVSQVFQAAAASRCGMVALAAVAVLLLAGGLYRLVYWPLVASPLAAVPGPKLYALTKWRLAYDDWRGTRTRRLCALHAQYGAAVRVGPGEVSFASLAALRAVYGAGSGFERTTFYRMFDVYGRQNLFTFGPGRPHAARKKALAHAYAKTAVLRPDGRAARLLADHVADFLAVVEAARTEAGTDAGGGGHDLFRSLHWFSLDSITGFLYGEAGGTHALRGCEADRRLLDDIVDPARRRLSWFAVHLPALTRRLYALPAWAERLLAGLGLFPMRRPATYTAIRAHALRSWAAFEAAEADRKDNKGEDNDSENDTPIIARLHAYNRQTGGRLDGLDMASELADHFLAGIDTTSDTLLFAIWALSRPEHAAYQARLAAEVASLDALSLDTPALDARGNPTAAAADRLPFLDAVLRETLRLYAPLPATEPRVMPGAAAVVDGVALPAGTVVGMDPYTLHRNPAVFPQPLAFRPERWLGEDPALGDVAAMRRWFWAFSSGARMCIGMHLAMAEMTMLLSALYRRYATQLHAKQVGASPGITSRFEVFADETLPRVLVGAPSPFEDASDQQEHECWVTFTKRG